jgi:hypothetical protein
MSKPLVIEDEPLTPEMARAFENARRNLLWFDAHVVELEVYKRYRGKYVASAGGELFVADTPEEVERQAHEKYPDDLPHVRYIQREKLSPSMHVIGDWLICDDGVIRPTVFGLVRAADGRMVEVTFLLLRDQETILTTIRCPNAPTFTKSSS